MTQLKREGVEIAFYSYKKSSERRRPTSNMRLYVHRKTPPSCHLCRGCSIRFDVLYAAILWEYFTRFFPIDFTLYEINHRLDDLFDRTDTLVGCVAFPGEEGKMRGGVVFFNNLPEGHGIVFDSCVAPLVCVGFFRGTVTHRQNRA